MPSANECELASVYIRYTDTASHGGISEESIKDNQSFDLCLGLEAGQTIFNQGAQYNLFVVLNDLSDSSKTVYKNTQAGSLGDPKWPAMDTTFSWTVPAGSISLADDHVYQAIGVMSVGKADPIVDMDQSALFIVTQP
ncbi:MAG TPA: hypothetical protein VKB62_12600 [Streptosporangiaceae bacterium]|nr:hypothetical protein [Streptosporangiaceae bacterium]